MKDIVARSGGEAKLRLRGKGSGFEERDTGAESTEPLQLCVSCPSQRGYDIARRCVEDLLWRVYGDYDTWCEEQGRSERAPKIRMTERHVEAGAPGAGGEGRRRGGKGRKPKAIAAAPHRPERDAPQKDVDHGEAPENAPPIEEIEQLISDRNDARKNGDYKKADEIRDDLKSRGVVLSDEKGGHGHALGVTSWRYWHA